jgi:hypothetical protein
MVPQMTRYRFADYFGNEVLRERPYLTREWCARALDHPLRSEPQESNRYRLWGETKPATTPKARKTTVR